MNNKYIGVFDSGLGGLTVVKAIQKSMSNESIVYYGDSKNCPYGEKGKDQIVNLALEDAKFLNQFDLKAIVIACNTADSVAGKIIAQNYQIPVYGVIYPASLKAIQTTKNKKIGIIATNACVNSNAYVNTIKQIDETCEVYQKACPRFVEFVESGRTNILDKEVFLYAKECLEPLIKQNIDTLILGCTHYPLLEEIIKKIVGNITIISSSEAMASFLQEDLKAKNLLSINKKESMYYASKVSEDYNQLAKLFLQQDIKIKES